MDSPLSQLLGNSKFCLLTTFRRSGQGVPTPMWFVVQDEVVTMTTRSTSGKIKRLRHDPRVTLARCTSSGKPLGPKREGRAVLVEEPDEKAHWEKVLTQKYGLVKKVADLALRLGKGTNIIIRVEAKEESA